MSETRINHELVYTEFGIQIRSHIPDPRADDRVMAVFARLTKAQTVPPEVEMYLRTMLFEHEAALERESGKRWCEARAQAKSIPKEFIKHV